MGKVISDVRNNVPTGKVLAELIAKKSVHKCSYLLYNLVGLSIVGRRE